MTLSTLALLFGRVKLALLTNYLFALYWGYFLNRDLFSELTANNGEYFMFIYFGLGIAVTVLALIGFFSAGPESYHHCKQIWQASGYSPEKMANEKLPILSSLSFIPIQMFILINHI
jgi:hypothetical protein